MEFYELYDFRLMKRFIGLREKRNIAIKSYLKLNIYF